MDRQAEACPTRYSLVTRRPSPPAPLPEGEGRKKCRVKGHPASGSVERDGHGLQLGVVVEGLLAQLAADAGHLEAAEGGGGVEDVVAVDPDGAGPEAVGDRVGLADVAGPD